jgi:hypothetical protein
MASMQQRERDLFICPSCTKSMSRRPKQVYPHNSYVHLHSSCGPARSARRAILPPHWYAPVLADIYLPFQLPSRALSPLMKLDCSPGLLRLERHAYRHPYGASALPSCVQPKGGPVRSAVGDVPAFLEGIVRKHTDLHLSRACARCSF